MALSRLTVWSAGQVLRADALNAEFDNLIDGVNVWPSSFVIGDLLQANTASSLATLAAVATGNALLSGGVGAVSSWGKVGLTTHVSGTLPVANGGTNLTAGTSGGILGYTATGTLASSVLLTANALLLGGGAGATPTPLGSLGTTTTLLHGNAAGAPTFGAVSLTADVSGILPTANGGTGIAFFTAAGPTVARVYTFPDAASTVLTTNAAVTVAQGGTAAATAQAAIDTLTAVSGATNEHVLTKDTASGNAIFKAAAGGGAVATDVIWDAKGDLAVGTGADTAAKLTVGANGTIPVADSGAATGISWLLAVRATVLTSETTTSTSFTDLATAGPAVTVTIGASGRAVVILGAQFYSDGTSQTTDFAVSGATTRAASYETALMGSLGANTNLRMSAATLLTGLTAGSNTFTMKYVVGSGTGSWLRRHIVVIPL